MDRHLAWLAAIAAWSLIAGCAGHQTNSTTDDPSTHQSSEKVQRLFSKGNEHLRAERWQRAIDCYRRATRSDSERWDIWLNLGIAHSRAGHYEKALDAMERSLRHGGDDRADVYYNLGNIYQRYGRHTYATSAYRDALKRTDDPKATTYTNLGTSLMAMDRPEPAVEAYRNALELAPDRRRARHGLALALHRAGRHEPALERLDAIRDDHPKMTRLHFDRARVLAALDRRARAIDALEIYLDRAPDGPFADRARAMRSTLASDSPDADDERPSPSSSDD